MKNKVKLTLDGQEVLVEEFSIDYGIEAAYPTVEVKGRLCANPYESPTWKADWGTTTQAVSFSAEETAEKMIKDISEWQGQTWKYTGCNEITIHDVNTKEIEKIMGYKDEDCAKACDGDSRGNLAKRVKDLKLTDDERLLRKYNVVYDDGQLTHSGKELIFQLLLDDYQEEIVEKLRELEEAETED